MPVYLVRLTTSSLLQSEFGTTNPPRVGSSSSPKREHNDYWKLSIKVIYGRQYQFENCLANLTIKHFHPTSWLPANTTLGDDQPINSQTIWRGLFFQFKCRCLKKQMKIIIMDRTSLKKWQLCTSTHLILTAPILWVWSAQILLTVRWN